MSEAKHGRMFFFTVALMSMVNGVFSAGAQNESRVKLIRGGLLKPERFAKTAGVLFNKYDRNFAAPNGRQGKRVAGGCDG